MQKAAGSDGRTSVEVSWGDRVRGCIRLGDSVKPTSAQAISELRGMGIRPVLLTGDSTGSPPRVARQRANLSAFRGETGTVVAPPSLMMGGEGRAR